MTSLLRSTGYRCSLCGERSAGICNRGYGPYYTNCGHYVPSGGAESGARPWSPRRWYFVTEDP